MRYQVNITEISRELPYSPNKTSITTSYETVYAHFLHLAHCGFNDGFSEILIFPMSKDCQLKTYIENRKQ